MSFFPPLFSDLSTWLAYERHGQIGLRFPSGPLAVSLHILLEQGRKPWFMSKSAAFHSSSVDCATEYLMKNTKSTDADLLPCFAPTVDGVGSRQGTCSSITLGHLAKCCHHPKPTMQLNNSGLIVKASPTPKVGFHANVVHDLRSTLLLP